MPLAGTNTLTQLRTLLILGRVSNLPTVWSNCLAGWLLGGGGESSLKFAALCMGTTGLYLGGMFLNDAFDADFDRQHRKERPIPSAAIAVGEVWIWGFSWLAVGTLFLTLLGKTTAILALVLAGSILLYDAVHKIITFSPVLMAACRFLLYLVAASTGREGVTGLTVWSALVLGAYIIGLSYLARKESVRGPLRYWPCYLLATPILLALLVNDGQYRMRALVLSAILGAWIIRCLRFTFGGANRSIGLTVAGLLAGIVLVDLLAVAGAAPVVGSVFALFFVAALLFQRFIPAT
ncbi:MAG: UbiA family prenyltransferase [Verrucomicrobia bacterium]|nr:UbiA family prenyltransferase [Verrucomicrobiota bacterium]